MDPAPDTPTRAPRAVLVSGASSGIGRASALRLAREGFVVFAGVRREADGQALAREAPERIVPVILDVTRADDIAAAVAAVAARCGEDGLAGLVNNAGTVLAAPLEFVPLEDVREQFEVNVLGVLALTQACLPLLRRSGGRTVIVGSISGRVASPLVGPYAMSKFAVEALADALRRELEPWRLEVALIEPGRVRTPIWDKSLAAAERLAERLPPEALELYGEAIAAVRARAAARSDAGVAAESVAEVVHRALVASRPRPRYLVGRDARIADVLARALPDRLLDRLFARGR